MTPPHENAIFFGVTNELIATIALFYRFGTIKNDNNLDIRRQQQCTITNYQAGGNNIGRLYDCAGSMAIAEFSQKTTFE